VVITNKPRRDPADRATELTKLASEMTAGGAAGLATGEPIGALAGAGAPVLSRVLVWSVNEFRQRVLGQRQEYRVATAIRLMQAKYEDNLRAGKQLRTDDFFLEDKGEGRSSAHEIVEATLLAAEREYEEKKLPYYANLVANLPFRPDIDRDTANLLLRLAQELSYRQLSLLALVAKKDEHVLPTTPDVAQGITWEARSCRQELAELGYARRELVLAVPNANLPTNIGVPSDFVLANEATVLYELMELSEIPDGELYKLSSVLRESAGMATRGD
jgi:hypothetical protein